MIEFDREYSEHRVFRNLGRYAEFYSNLSFGVFHYPTPATRALHNMDAAVFDSVKGTLDSIGAILRDGHINDAYALVRKYFDSAIINVYSGIYLNENRTTGKLSEIIEGWRKGTKPLPRIKGLLSYIAKSERLKPLTALLKKDGRYARIRSRCNGHVHYNYYAHMLLNVPELYIPDRVSLLDQLNEDICDVFILHLAYVFYLNQHYMMASDYLDKLELGQTPDEREQYLVAPYVQAAFDEIIQCRRPDVAEFLRSETVMLLK